MPATMEAPKLQCVRIVACILILACFATIVFDILHTWTPPRATPAAVHHQSLLNSTPGWSITSSFERRTVNDGEHKELYEKYVAKGAKFVEFLDIADDETLQSTLRRDGKLKKKQKLASKFTTTSDLHANGWVEQQRGTDSWWIDDRAADFLPILRALESSGFSTAPLGKPNGQIVVADWLHADDSDSRGVMYFPTLGRYVGAYNAAQGVIMATYALGPASSLEDDNDWLTEEYPDIEPPPLSRWADVTFLAYQGICQRQKKTTKKLDTFIGVLVDGIDAAKMISQLLYLSGVKPNAEGGIEAPPWQDRKEFTMDTDEGKAILGSYVNGGLPWFLMQHRAQLGAKKVKSVSIFLSERPDNNHPCLWFTLEDVGASEACEAGPAKRGMRFPRTSCGSISTVDGPTATPFGTHSASSTVSHTASAAVTRGTASI